MALKAKNVKFKAQIVSPSARQITPLALWTLTAEPFVIVILDIKVKDVNNVPMIKYAKMEVTVLKMFMANFGANAHRVRKNKITRKNFFFQNVQKLIYFSRKKYLFLHQDLLVRGAILIFVIMLNVKMVGLVFLHLMVPNANVLRTSKALFAKTMPAKDIVNMVERLMGNCNHRGTINVIVIVLLALLDCIAKKIRVLPFNVSMEAIVPSSEAVKYAIAH